MVNKNKKFWKTVKPLFSNKLQSSSSITLLGNSKVESTASKVAEVFYKYFVNIAESLDIHVCFNKKIIILPEPQFS